MPLRLYRCSVCGTEFKTKMEKKAHCEAAEAIPVMTVPETKFLEKTDEEHGKSAMVGQQAILKARSRAHARDNETQDLVATNTREIAEQNKWIDDQGRVRKKINDI